MMILIHFHQSHYRIFKAYYLEHVMVHLRSEFPNLFSYPRFVALMKESILPLSVYLYSMFGSCSGVAFVDSISLVVCHNRCISQNKVFAGIAAQGKTSMGWFYGSKLHLVVNDQGELLASQLTPGNTMIVCRFRSCLPFRKTNHKVLPAHLFGSVAGPHGRPDIHACILRIRNGTLLWVRSCMKS